MDRDASESLSRFLRKIFAPGEKPPADLGHALTALRKGLIDSKQLQQALENKDSVLKQLQDNGALDPEKLAMLFGSGMIVNAQDALENLLDGDDAPGAYAKGDLIGGRYRVLYIKRGGFGVVYICEAPADVNYSRGNRLVALKCLLRQHLAKPQAVELFYTEASNWISLGAHPNIVLAYGVEAYTRTHFIVMEFIEGAKTLADEIYEGRTDWRRALRVGVDVARGLAYAQRKARLVHGDLKPLNLLVTTSGAIKVADFGLSVCQQAFSDGVLAGTEGFIAPEMYLGETGRTISTDIYAFGVVLFQTANRRLPFPADEAIPAKFAPEIPGEFAQFILACLQREPNKRPENFEIIATLLEKMHTTLLGMAPPESASPDAPLESDAFVNLAQSWLELGDTRKAHDFAQRAIQSDSRNWKAHHVLGNIQNEMGEYRQGFRSFANAHELAPEEIIPLTSAARSCHLDGDLHGAWEWLEPALEICRRTGDYSGLDGASLVLVEILGADALPLLDEILAASPDAAMTWNNRAILLRRMKQPGEALASADRAIQLNPAYAKAWANRANALIELGRFDDALESATRSLAIDPMVAGAYAARATALAQTGRLDEARKCIESGLSRIPGNPLLLRAREMFSH